MKRLLVVALLALGCRPSARPAAVHGAGDAGRPRIAPEALERGRATYTHHCRPCHGDDGNGKGLSAAGLRPQPRDLQPRRLQFAAVPAGQLPHDADFVRTLRHGLHGTAMLSWDVPPPRSMTSSST